MGSKIDITGKDLIIKDKTLEVKNEDQKSNALDLYKRYNECRDAELDRFWKNSIFVWVFLALCFTALGSLIKDYNMPTKAMSESKQISQNDYYLFLNIISGIGFILSWIWVWMARGLKAWYEVYEMAIWNIETYKNEFQYPQDYLINNFWTIKESRNWITSAKPYSPSKIVILIGWLLVIIWGGALLYSIIRFSIPTLKCCYSFIVILIGLIIIGIIILFRCFSKSSALRNKDANKLFQNIRQELNSSKQLSNTYLEIRDKNINFGILNQDCNTELLNLFPDIHFHCNETFVTCSYKEMQSYYQIIDLFRNMLKNDFDLFHQRITQNKNNIIVHSNDKAVMRKIKKIFLSRNNNKYLKDKTDEMVSKIENEISIIENSIIIPKELINYDKIDFKCKLHYYKSKLIRLTKKIVCASNRQIK